MNRQGIMVFLLGGISLVMVYLVFGTTVVDPSRNAVSQSRKLISNARLLLTQDQAPAKTGRDYYWHILREAPLPDSTSFVEGLRFAVQRHDASGFESLIRKSTEKELLVFINFTISPANLERFLDWLKTRPQPMALTAIDLLEIAPGSIKVSMEIGVFRE